MLLAMAISAKAQLLWKISGNGLNQPSYVFGTHHLAPVSIVDSVPLLSATLEAVDRVCGEIVLDEMQSPAVLQAIQQAVVLPGDTTLQALYTPRQYEELGVKLKELIGIDVAQLNKIKPSYIVNQLNMLFAMKAVKDFNPQQQIDTWLQAWARQMNKEVTGLETADFQVGMLFDFQSLDRQARMLLCAVGNTDIIQQQLAQLTEAYMKQDIAQLERVINTKYNNDLDALPAEEDALIHNRNRNWIKLMPAIMNNGSTLFAVGAGHLVGAEGLLQLLKSNGYTVEEVR